MIYMEKRDMLRRIIKAVIPSRGEIFFDLFIQAAENVDRAADLLADIINTVDKKQSEKLSKELRGLRQKAVDFHSEILHELNSQFITPIDRGDIHQISTLQVKLVKRIIKINKKLKIYAIDAQVDDCLIQGVNTLQSITTCLMHVMAALKASDHVAIKVESCRVNEFDEKVIDDLGDAMKKIKAAQYDHLTIIKLKEIYKALEGVIDTSETLCDVTMMVSIKAI